MARLINPESRVETESESAATSFAAMHKMQPNRSRAVAFWLV